MPTIHVELDVPAEVFEEGLSREEFTEAVRRQAVLQLVRNGKLSQGRAAEVLGVSRAELFELMGDEGVDHVNYAPSELAADAEAAAGALDRRERQ